MNDKSKASFDIEALYNQYAGMVFRRCQKILKDDAAAMDTMQDVFVKLIDKHSSIQDLGLSSLLYQMATNLSLNIIAKQKVRKDYILNNPVHDEDEIDQLSDVESQVIDESTLLQFLQYFEVRECEIAIYHYVDGYTLDEVAQLKNLSKSTVRRLLSQMRQKITQLQTVGEHE